MHLILQAANGALVSDPSEVLKLSAPIIFANVAQGTGNSGFFFMLDSAGVALANNFWASLGQSLTLRVGLAATLNGAVGGLDTFYLARREGGGGPPQAEVPEPASSVLCGLGLLSAAFFLRRRKLR
jgi:hypothetical protein